MKELTDAHILVVDDSKVNLDFLIGILGSRYRIGVALNGQSALEITERNHPDMILLDIVMPEMDGFEVCRRLKENPETADITVLFISALDDSESRSRIFETGAADYIPKPFNSKELLCRVENYLKLRLAEQ